MPSRSRLVRNLTVVAVFASISHAIQLPSNPPPSSEQSAPAPPVQPVSWTEELWSLPILRSVAPLFGGLAQPLALPSEPGTSGLSLLHSANACPVAPLDPITDPAAEQFEATVDSGDTVDVAGMLPAAAKALTRFSARVAALGGTMVLKSAYRPAAYQQHLQNVWYKWIGELRYNQNPGCEPLRAAVQEEFLRHHLIETQHPVAISDHTRGLAFDATIALPVRAVKGRRRISLDSLARLAGLLRPAILSDPVHYKYVGALRTLASRTVRRRHSAA